MMNENIFPLHGTENFRDFQFFLIYVGKLWKFGFSSLFEHNFHLDLYHIFAPIGKFFDQIFVTFK